MCEDIRNRFVPDKPVTIMVEYITKVDQLQKKSDGAHELLNLYKISLLVL